MSESSINGKTPKLQIFSGKIGIVTSSSKVNKSDFRSVKPLINKYGEDKIVHRTWPENFMSERGQMTEIVEALAADRDVRAILINQAYIGSNAAIDAVKKTRDDLFIVYCWTHEPVPEAVTRANLLLWPNEMGMGQAMVRQAKKQGAGVFVHYSFQRHLILDLICQRRDKIRETCAAEGLRFVEAAALDPVSDAGPGPALQFILEDVPRMVAKYGVDTAFFATNCALQAPLIKAVVDCRAIYTQPCCPSPFHGFPEALGIQTEDGSDDLNYIIGEACRIAAEKNMTDRLSTWPVSASMMFTNAGAEYAIKWLRGEVPKTGIDETALMDCMSSYVKEVVGEKVEVEMSSYSENGTTFDNFKLALMSYLDF